MAIKFAKTQYTPALFDVAQDIVGALPLKLIEKWLVSEQTQGVAVRELDPYRVKGYSVSSDSAGLTKLSMQRGLLEILAIIEQPKEIVYRYGTAIGGQGVGVWAADNTQMFYPGSVAASDLVSALLTIQDEVNAKCLIKIGLGAHAGEFYSVSGGLYGAEADAIEEIAENETEGGEIVISQSIHDRLPAGHPFRIVQKSEHPTSIGHVYQVLDGPRLSGVGPASTTHPIAFSAAFHADLVAFQSRLNDAAFGRHLADRYMKEKCVVLIERESKTAETPEVAIFENLAMSAMMKNVGLLYLPRSNGEEIKVAGALAIYVFDDAPEALAFARAFRQELARQEISCRIGIDAGSVLICELPTGGKDIAGMPVNVASKMAQDKGKPGKLYLSQAVKDHVDASGFVALSYVVSGVELTVYES